MKLDEVTKRQAFLHISSKCQPLKCPMCQSTSGFNMDDSEYQIQSFERTGTNLDISQSHYIPCVALSCKNCGHISMFSLLAMGIELK